MRREFTAQWRGKQELIESACPNVFLLHPRRDFDTFESLFEYFTQGDKWRLTMFCESDEDWHETGDSVYDFTLNADWIELIRPSWNPAADAMRKVAPILKAAGKFTGKKELEAIGLASEKLPDVAADQRKLREELGYANSPARVDISLRRTLAQLIERLDIARTPAKRTGGLNKWANEDGRVLWLCPHHYGALRTRVSM